jgi:hypothetical protein
VRVPSIDMISSPGRRPARFAEAAAGAVESSDDKLPVDRRHHVAAPQGGQVFTFHFFLPSEEKN